MLVLADFLQIYIHLSIYCINTGGDKRVTNMLIPIFCNIYEAYLLSNHYLNH
jgi:hypothetical protein